MELTDYQKLVLKHAQIQTSMMNIQLVLLASIFEGQNKGEGKEYLEALESYKNHCDVLDRETCKALGTTVEC